jgi:hypothetical protein
LINKDDTAKCCPTSETSSCCPQEVKQDTLPAKCCDTPQSSPCCPQSKSEKQ